MNSIYGGTANEYYYFCSVDAADDITAEGRFFIKAGEHILNNYLRHEWHLDYETHNALKQVESLKSSFADLTPNQVVKQLDTDADYVMYMDTDSMYVTFETLFESIGFDPMKEGKFAEFIMELNAIKLRSLFAEQLGAIIDARNGENYLKFDLESISETTIFVKKKKYVMSYKMEDDKVYDDSTKHIKGKGVEIIQSTMSNEVKNMLKFLIVQLFKGQLTNENYKTYIRYLYKQFCNFNIQEKCSYQSANTYAKNVLNDTTGLEFAKGTDAVIKGMALYNYKVKQKNLMTQYELIKGGKVAWYYSADGGQFAFPIGEFPTDLDAPEIDNLRQFNKLVVNPISRIAVFGGIDVSNPLATHTTLEI
jgi:DNA polymerase elongation subunit (family B)